MKELKILNIVTRLNIGGVSIHVVQISQMFNSGRYSSIVLYGDVENNEKDMLYLANQYDFPMINLPSMGRSNNPLEDILLIWKVFKVIKKLKPDIVHTHTAKAGFIGRTAAWLAKTPIILHTFHGNNFSGYFGKLMSAFSINAERLLASISTRIIAISEQQRDELIKFRICPKEKTRIIHLGFDFSKITHSASDVGAFKAAYSIASNHKFIAFVGRLTAIKNPHQFIKIASAVLESRQDVVFAFVGDGEMAEELKKEVRRLGFQENIIFTGFIQDLKPLYADLDILLLTSSNEGTPVAIIEAMANRKIVVASRVGGIPNLITHTKSGFLFPPWDTNSFFKTIESILAVPADYLEIAENGYQKITRDYSTQRFKTEMENLLNELTPSS
ncbi:MAG: glycosyltransferase family 4 protein [Candidatus Cloacimonadaceae bacterium]|nr:glycosyltransferase family 4 protein [Candidatus Cloacimonadaceae bacterium]